MKIVIQIFCAFVCWGSLNAQVFIPRLEESEKWGSYTSVVENFGSNGQWQYEYILLEGRVDTVNTYFYSEKRGVFKNIYDENFRVKYEVEIKCEDGGCTVDTFLFLNARYDKSGLRIEDSICRYTYNDRGQLIERFSKNLENSKGMMGWIETVSYDVDGDLQYRKRIQFTDGKERIDIDTLGFDDCKNVVSIRRGSFPEQQYPILVIGGRNRFQTEHYDYEYNSDCLWTKKYRIVDGKRSLIGERIFK